MDSSSYRRRATGELAIDPALFQLVMHSGALLDRLLCACGSPIPEAPPAALRRNAGDAAVGPDGDADTDP
jgi:hypothetical protein